MCLVLGQDMQTCFMTQRGYVDMVNVLTKKFCIKVCPKIKICINILKQTIIRSQWFVSFISNLLKTSCLKFWLKLLHKKMHVFEVKEIYKSLSLTHINFSKPYLLIIEQKILQSLGRGNPNKERAGRTSQCSWYRHRYRATVHDGR